MLFELYRGRGANLDELLVPAVSKESVSFVELLLEAGVKANDEVMTRWGANRNPDIVELLLRAGGVPTFDVMRGILRDKWLPAKPLLYLEAFLASGQVSLSQEAIDMLLEEAVDLRHSAAVQRKLIEGYGANVDIECRDGTPLITACRLRDDELALYLIDQGADIDFHRPGCWSARAYAKRYRNEMPMTWARIRRHELTRKASTATRRRAVVNDVGRRAM